MGKNLHQEGTPMTLRSQNSAREWLLILALSFLWGGSFLFYEIALTGLPLFTIVAGRVVLAALALQAIVRLRGLTMPRSWAVWRNLALMGLFNNAIPFSLIVFAAQQITASLASILNATTPLFTLLLARFLFRAESLTAGKVCGVAIGVAGVALLVGPDALTGLGDQAMAQLAMLAAALSYGLAGNLGRRLKDLPPLVVATGQVSTSSLMILPLALILERPWLLPTPSLEASLAVIGLALLCTALAYLLFFAILQSGGATRVSLVTLLIPPSAAFMGWLFLDESLSPRQVAGMAIIGLALATIDGRLWRVLRGLKARAIAG